MTKTFFAKPYYSLLLINEGSIRLCVVYLCFVHWEVNTIESSNN